MAGDAFEEGLCRVHPRQHILRQGVQSVVKAALRRLLSCFPLLVKAGRGLWTFQVPAADSVRLGCESVGAACSLVTWSIGETGVQQYRCVGSIVHHWHKPRTANQYCCAGTIDWAAPSWRCLEQATAAYDQSCRVTLCLTLSSRSFALWPKLLADETGAGAAACCSAVFQACSSQYRSSSGTTNILVGMMTFCYQRLGRLQMHHSICWYPSGQGGHWRC